MRFWAGTETSGDVEGGVVVFSWLVGVMFCVLESDWRNGEPQRGQDLLVHDPRLEPHEVQYMFSVF